MEHECKLRNWGLVADIYIRYADDLKQYLIGYTHDVMAAEDMLHDLFVKAMSLDVLSEATAHNLLFVMAKRMIVDNARHMAFVRESEKRLRCSMTAMDSSSLARRIEAADILSFESRHLARMPKKRACIYKMYKHENMTADEIARELNISRRTVESHIYLSTHDMKKYLENII